MNIPPVVLIVDDEPAPRKAIKRILEMNGIIVLEASDGPDAIRVSDRYPGEIDLLLLDHFMPGMTGVELANHLRERRPKVSVIYVTGYDHMDVQNGVVHKPVDADVLIARIREKLTGLR